MKLDIRVGDSYLFLHRLSPELPKKFEQYDKHSDKLAIVIPLFKPYPKPRLSKKSEQFIKIAMWSRQSLIENTNVIEMGVPVLFYIEDTLFDENAKYFEAQGMDDSCFVIFTVKRDTQEEINFYHNRNANTGLCQLPLLDKRLQKYERLIIQDADLFFCKTSHATEKYDILSVLETCPEEKIGVLSFSSDTPYIPSHWIKVVPENSVDSWKKLLSQVYNNFLYQNLTSICGVWCLFSPNFHGIGTPYGDHVSKTIYMLRCDEAISAIYRAMHLDSFVICNDVPYPRTDVAGIIAEETGTPYYHFHFRNQQSFERIFRNHIGDIIET